MSKVEVGMFNSLIPSYKDIIKKVPLLVFSGRILNSHGESYSQVEGGIDSLGNRLAKPIPKAKGGKKGVVFGGVSNPYSPIKTRSSKKKEIETIRVQEVPRDLRYQASLLR